MTITEHIIGKWEEKLEVILRPVYDRPEMLQLSMESEVAARKFYNLADFLTIFIIEHNSPQKTIQLVEEYPYNKFVINRKEKLGLSANILNGLDTAFQKTTNFVIHLEDDTIIHKTYFKFMAILLSITNDWTVLSPFNHGAQKDPRKIVKDHRYSALAPLIDKTFFDEYIKPDITNYLNAPEYEITKLNNTYKNNKHYKFRTDPLAHMEQAGFINRKVDVAFIEQNKATYRPTMSRIQHIGFYGKNRPKGKRLKGEGFEERLKELRKIICSESKLCANSDPRYMDYKVMSPELDDWDGKLYVG